MTLWISGLLAAVLAAAPVAASGADDGHAVVRTAAGAVRGLVTADHRIFHGVPYAAAPVGALRLRAPRPRPPWSGVRQAVKPAPICPQTYAYPPGAPTRYDGSEDCLYLNVHVPRDAGRRLPVMVFLHGGNSGAGSHYDPRPVTGAGNVIVVTVNYRLGALGFLLHDALPDPYAGNLALADQQAALRWVRTEIAAFGGDAGNVTLWGESFGGFGVCANLASPSARGLFDKAVVQSASCGNHVVTRAEAVRRGHRAVAALGCDRAPDVAACLRALPAERIAALPNTATHQRDIAAAMPWFYTAGTPALPRQPLHAARTGLIHGVPLIHGGTRDEMRGVLARLLNLEQNTMTADRYRSIVHDRYGRDAVTVLNRYPAARYATPSLALATLQTDEGRTMGTCSQWPFNTAHRAPVYAYEFAEDSGDTLGDLPLGASHGDDVRYFFDSYLPGVPAEDTDPGLTAELIGRWTAFAHTGRPGPGWAPDRPGTALSLSSAEVRPVNVYRQHQCRFWRPLLPR
ncbi:carboxylesterase family protein [Actinoplanes sp. NPDC024001]|uniref:carboxylesterase/lipase family protein n=1 Tax=Actinoplanes sp. NPDC024001 TaxID=3154598 RepID=UPI00340433C3